MPLALDLSATDAKIARARAHFETLKGEADRSIQEHNPYTTRIVKVDKDACWYAVFLIDNEVPAEKLLGIILGDLVHNLRSALDYIVTALVDASPGAKLGRKHQFPIFDVQTEYEGCVGNNVFAHPKGPLGGVTIGLQEIWDLQPFHRKKDPRGDPLSVVHRFSNADKHRVIAQNMPFLADSVMQVFPDGIVERIQNPVPHRLGIDKEYEVGRVRYDAPGPANVYLKGQASVDVQFTTPAFGQHPRGLAISLSYFDAICDVIAKATERFKAL